MDLTTRCPQCGTCFSASLEQLKLRKGYIRCVNCANIFDGYEAVVDGDEARAPAQAEPVPVVPDHVVSIPVVPKPLVQAPEPVMPSVLRQRQRQTKHEPVFIVEPAPDRSGSASSPVAPAFRISTEPHNAASGVRRDPVISTSADTPGEPALAARPTVRAPIYVEPRVQSGNDDALVPEFLEREGRYQGAIRLFWSVLTVAGMLLLLAQLAYVYRSQIANQIPALRPALTEACVSLHCKVAYSRRIDQIAIMTSALKAPPGVAEPPNSMTLQLTLRNLYAQPQEWPTLVLDLTDFSGTVVARKNLAPANYLTSEALQHPFAASSEITVGVPIVLNDLKINGYQLSKFFP
ncbi:DUF3426 domain-containing protein [Alcaligenaceae bacterium]|nr:DUF3426 domain-containing protein [Alcaligenaceae bacterium]